ncbi:hypothetical protein ACLOJK_025468 [Asimina triloba]
MAEARRAESAKKEVEADRANATARQAQTAEAWGAPILLRLIRGPTEEKRFDFFISSSCSLGISGGDWISGVGGGGEVQRKEKGSREQKEKERTVIASIPPLHPLAAGGRERKGKGKGVEAMEGGDDRDVVRFGE